ncbi:MAG: hypothetical protein FRX49_12067 [Trebouxia sp. A1-2]|nr:MAG: hypothetical protein FRX49_12067 [Trebouxia sp. A1-2]
MPSEACMAGDRGMPCPTGALFLALIFFSLLHAAATYHSQSALTCHLDNRTAHKTNVETDPEADVSLANSSSPEEDDIQGFTVQAALGLSKAGILAEVDELEAVHAQLVDASGGPALADAIKVYVDHGICKTTVTANTTHGESAQAKEARKQKAEGKARKGKERKGKERKGKERKGKERKGKERKGKERKGKERKGKERKGKERKGKERLRLLAWIKDKAKGHLGVQDTKLMQRLHHFLVINIASVVSIVSPAHQSHGCVSLVWVILVATCMPGDIPTIPVHLTDGHRIIATHMDTYISAV